MTHRMVRADISPDLHHVYQFTDEQIAAMIKHGERVFAEWEARASEGHCIRESCIGRLRTLRPDEVAFLDRGSRETNRHVIGRCLSCGSFTHRFADTGEVSGEFWSSSAPPLLLAAHNLAAAGSTTNVATEDE